MRANIRLTAMGLAAGSLLAGTGIGATTQAAGAPPRLTVVCRYAPKLRNLVFHGLMVAPAPAMVSVAQFRLEVWARGHWRPDSVWMALITGENARWAPSGRYTSGLMAMQTPVARGRYRVQVRAVDSDGGRRIAASNPVAVP